MTQVPGEALFGRKRSLVSSPWAAHSHLEDPARQRGRELVYVWVGDGSAGQPPTGSDERALNQPSPHPSSKTVVDFL